MPRVTDRDLTAGEAARALGISLDTLRRWDREGKIRVERDAANRRVVPAAEIARLREQPEQPLSARNHFRGVVREMGAGWPLEDVRITISSAAHAGAASQDPGRVVGRTFKSGAYDLPIPDPLPAGGLKLSFARPGYGGSELNARVEDERTRLWWMLFQLKGIGRLPFGRASSASWGLRSGRRAPLDRDEEVDPSGCDAAQSAAAAGRGDREAGQILDAAAGADVHLAVTVDAEQPVAPGAAPLPMEAVMVSMAGMARRRGDLRWGGSRHWNAPLKGASLLADGI